MTAVIHIQTSSFYAEAITGVMIEWLKDSKLIEKISLKHV